MSTNVTWNGTVYAIPAAGEVGWSALSNFLIALGTDAAITQEMKQAIRVALTTPVTVSNTTDCVVATNLSVAGAVAVTLPAGTDGRWFIIVDQKGDAATNNITITPNGAETVNGAATFVMNQNNEGVVLAYSSTNTRWNVISRFTAGAPLTNPMTTRGDMIRATTGGTPQRFAAVTNNRVVRGDGTDVVLGQIDSTDFFAAGAAGTTSARGVVRHAEGVWTPTIAGDGGAFGSVTYAGQSGWYERIGANGLFLNFRVAWSAASGGTGNIRITGVPFTLDGAYPGNGYLAFSNLDISAGYTTVGCQPGSGTFLDLLISGDNAAVTTIAVTVATTGSFNKDLRGTVFAVLA